MRGLRHVAADPSSDTRAAGLGTSDHAAADAPDLLITEQAMPRLTGLALTQRLRRRHPDLPVLLCTGNAEMVLPDALQRLGIQAHKPIDARRLREMVQRCLAVPRS